jgi:hypothetical protein
MIRAYPLRVTTMRFPLWLEMVTSGPVPMMGTSGGYHGDESNVLIWARPGGYRRVVEVLAYLSRGWFRHPVGFETGGDHVTEATAPTVV